MPFPSPAVGYEESPVGDTIIESLIPKPSSTICWKVRDAFDEAQLEVGDVIVVEQDRRPHNGCLALIDCHGETIVCKLFWTKGRWYALSNDRKGAVTEDMVLKGVGRWLIRDQVARA